MNVADQQLEESQLIEAAQRDPRAFAALYDRHFDQVYAYVARRVGHRQETEDITADVFHRALEKLPHFEWRGIPFIVWLLRIAANSIADHWRGPRESTGGHLPESVANITELDVAGAERRALLAQLVSTLPEIQRQVILGRFVYERSVAELAQQLKRTVGAVKQLQFRAIHSLRAGFESQSRRDDSHG